MVEYYLGYLCVRIPCRVTFTPFKRHSAWFGEYEGYSGDWRVSLANAVKTAVLLRETKEFAVINKIHVPCIIIHWIDY